jgi:hypothetical protein
VLLVTESSRPLEKTNASAVVNTTATTLIIRWRRANWYPTTATITLLFHPLQTFPRCHRIPTPAALPPPKHALRPARPHPRHHALVPGIHMPAQHAVPLAPTPLAIVAVDPAPANAARRQRPLHYA